MTNSMNDGVTNTTLLRDVEELCAFFRRRGRDGVGERYELLQVGSKALSTKWGNLWAFEGRNNHAAEKVGWMMRRMVDPLSVPVRHACRVRLRRHTGQARESATEFMEVVVITVLPDRAQFVLLLASGVRVTGLPFLRCGGAEVVAVAMGLIPTNKVGDHTM